MINTLSLAFLILSGYIFSINSLTIRYKLKRAEGWGAYFYVAMWGGLFSAISWVVCSLLSYSDGFRDTYNWMLSHHFFDKELVGRLFPLNTSHVTPAGTVADTKGNLSFLDLKVLVWGVTSILLAFFTARVVLPFCAWLRWGKDRKAFALASAVNDNHQEAMLIEASVRQYLLLITLGSRKFYVGIVICPKFDNGKAEYLQIIPMLSGYRDKDTMVTHVTSNYKRLYVESGLMTPEGRLIEPPPVKAGEVAKPRVEIQDFRTLICFDEIETISFFDSDTYNNFKDAEEKDKEHSKTLTPHLMPNGLPQQPEQ